MYRFPVVALVLALTLPAAAAEKFDPEALARAVAPFVDAQTVGVAHVDLTRIDAVAFLDKVAEIGKLEAEEVEGPKRDLRGLLAGLTRTGAKDWYVVFSMADLPAQPPFIVVPLGAGADAKAMSRELEQAKLFGQGHAEALGHAVLGGSEKTLKRLRTLEPTARPDLAKAFAAAGDSAVQVLLLPAADTRRVIAELLPTLPAEIGGESTTPLTHDLRWAALGMDLTPNLALRLVIQSTDPAAARKLSGFLTRTRDALGRLAEVREILPDFARLAALLTPEVEGDRLVVSLTNKELLTVVPPLVLRTLQAVNQHTAANKLQKVVYAAHSYVDAHPQGRFPAVANFDKQGRPLLSWRVHLLPFLGENKLYQEFHLDEPWNSAHNKDLIARLPAVYQGPNPKLNREGKTVYLAPVGPAAAFTGGSEGLRLPADFPDGTSNTILLVEADDEHAVVWTKPDDLKYDPEHPQKGLGGHFVGGFLVALADGSVRFLRKTISVKTLQNAFNPNDGGVLGDDW
jgi:hypothetical protein